VTADKQVLKALQERVRQIADGLGVPPELLATRRELAAVAAGQISDVFRCGWRGTVLGDMLREFSPASASQ
jgi:ribonuclease D